MTGSRSSWETPGEAAILAKASPIDGVRLFEHSLKVAGETRILLLQRDRRAGR
jgi:hypothetical protein